jgi:hypothetical protein
MDLTKLKQNMKTIIKFTLLLFTMLLVFSGFTQPLNGSTLRVTSEDGYLKANGTSLATSSTTIPIDDIDGVDTVFTHADTVAILATQYDLSQLGGGDVNGPGSSTDNAIVRFDGSGGVTLQNSGLKLDDVVSNRFDIEPFTSDASDDQGISINGGGGSGSSRGAQVVVYGNESTSGPQALVYGGSSGTVRLGNFTASYENNVIFGHPTNTVSGIGNIGISNTTTAPSTSMTNGVVLYSEDVNSSAELKVRDEAGNVTVLSDLTSGTYSPTISNSSLLNGSYTINTFFYTRIGNIVTVYGSIELASTSTGGAVSFDLTIPVASSISSLDDITGNCMAHPDDYQGRILGNTGDNEASVLLVTDTTNPQTYNFNFIYEVN